MRTKRPSARQKLTRLLSAEKRLVSEIVADGLSIQHKFRPEPLYKQAGKEHDQNRTVEEPRAARKSKPKGEPR